jgi:hypothetical protein
MAAPFAHNVHRVTISGTSFGGAEEWSTGFWLGEENENVAGASEATAETILNAWRTFFEHAGSNIGTDYLTTQVKVATYAAATGKTIDDEVFYAVPATELNGDEATIKLPPQCSVVVTLLSDRVRGKAAKGRMYLPGVSVMPGSNGKLPSAAIGTLADNVKTFFDALVNNANIPGELILAARGTGPFPNLTAQNDYVETIRVGDVVDTQRRRRNQLEETYTTRILA